MRAEGAARTAIVVLGAAVLADGPSPALAGRIALAARLWHDGAGAVVIGSGGLGRHPPSEARAIRDALVAAGVPPAAVREEDAARSTFENALNSIRLIRELGLERALVVTDAYHLPRALMTFRLLGMDTAGAGARPGASRPWLRRACEAAALPAYAGLLAWRLCRRGRLRR
jgi:uncharacterized SAM-binding protein YcdF (DUF218 family)